MKQGFTLLIAFLAFALMPLQAQQIYSKLSTDQLKKIFSEEGYDYTVDKGDIIWKIGEFKTAMLCRNAGACLSFLVVSTDSTTLAKINQWNRSKRFGRSYLDEDGDPNLQADLHLAGGVTRERINDFLRMCRFLLLEWRQEVLH